MNTHQTLQPVEILLVEDNPGDQRLTKEAFKGGKIINTLSIVEDGIEALDYLYQRGKYSKVTRPDLIILDLNLPRLSGKQVLETIKTDENLRRIPVIILTISQAEEDIIKSYDLHANCYVTKPLDIDQFNKVVQSIEEFWFAIVKLPTE
jgi:two-component system response regulator